MKIGFDNKKYLEEQTKAIKDRMKMFDGKLYLECGGKLIGDFHASRVLPGFDSDVKMKVFNSLKDDIEVIICINSGDIERRKVRSDYGITYDSDVFRLIEEFKHHQVKVAAVLITRYEEHPTTKQFIRQLESRNLRVYKHTSTPGYPHDVDTIVSDQGFGKNPYIPTEAKIVLVTAPGPGSGKMATCLCQLYHDSKMGKNSGYAKFETFPIWNLPLKHPVNIAYEAATADIGDFNLIDSYHLDYYGETVVSYNRDMDCYPLLKRTIEKITNKESMYKSPTDMGVNKVGFAICDDEVVKEASNQEIIRRYYKALCDYSTGLADKASVDRIKTIMNNNDLDINMRKVVISEQNALQEAIEKGKGKGGVVCAASLILDDGKVIKGANTSLLHASSALVLNAIKYLAGIPNNIDLIPKQTIDSIRSMKKNVLGSREVSLDLEEVLICLAISATVNPSVSEALKELPRLRNTQCHQSHIPTGGDAEALRKLGIIVTSEPKFASTIVKE